MTTDAGDTLEGDLLWAWAARQYFSEIYATAVDRAHAHRMLIWWFCFIADHPTRELVRLATTVSAWQEEFLAYFDQRITNGRTEGRNRTIKHVKRLGYGYRSTPQLHPQMSLPSTPTNLLDEPAKRPPAALNA